MAITKCVQTEENLIRMAKAAFPDKCLLKSEELTEGMCNAAYRLTFADGFKTILKISSPIKEGFMTNECNLMAAEVKAMRLAAEKTDIKVPAVYVYDTTRTICAGDYFFMECLEGASWSSAAGNLSEAENLALCEQTGKVQKKLQEQDKELHEYEEKIHHLADQFISIDLDDGVKKNYALFADVLTKIK